MTLTTTERRADFPLMMQATDTLLATQPAFRSLAETLAAKDATYWQNGEARCREILHLCGNDEGRFREAVGEWLKFSMEYLKKQRQFERTGEYACTDFAEVERDVYANTDVMRHSYLMALLFSFIFSPNYAAIFAFFQAEFLPRLAAARTVCDVGCGHGVYLTQMLLSQPGVVGTGLDISPGSLQTTRELIDLYQLPAQRVHLALGDLHGTLPVATASQDAVCCFEVIEHLAGPEHALSELRRILAPGGILCLSTAIRMESVDHLHLFLHPDEVRAMVTAAGFEVLQDACIPLSREDASDPATLARLIDDPATPLGYVMLGR